LSASLGAVACIIAGGAYPETDGPPKLRKLGVDEAVITSIVQGRPLSEDQFSKFARIQDETIAFLVARNPSLPLTYMRDFARSTNDFIRTGVAENPALPPEIFAQLVEDPSHAVWCGLAGNPGLDAKALKYVHDRHDLDWCFFVNNPSCPPEIDSLIAASDDVDAIKVLFDRNRFHRNWPVDRPPTPKVGQ
jgi:hypothetical protein